MFIGLDFETSGTSHEESAPIQLGISVDGHTFAEDIGGWDWDSPSWEGYRNRVWDESAFEVHGITKSRIHGAPRPIEVDAMAIKWLDYYAPRHPAGRIMVGWNVGQFDVPFLRNHFPRTARAMSYRSVDLNAVVFYMEQMGLGKYKDIKEASKEYAASELINEGWPVDLWHDAGYDAAAALKSFEYLIGQGREVIPPPVLR